MQAAQERIGELHAELAAKEKAAQAEAHLNLVRQLQPESSAQNPGQTAEQTEDELKGSEP